MTTARVLSLRDMNRALLSRQRLLERDRLPAADSAVTRAAMVVQTIEHLVGLQAQAPFPPYYGLQSRLDGFGPDDLAALITSRSVVRIALMRGTIHLVSARDCLPLRRLLQPAIERGMHGTFGQQLAGVDAAALAAAGRRLVESEPMTFSRLGHALAGQWPQHPPAALAQGVRALVPLVQVPPRAVWGQAGQARHTSAEHWLAPTAQAAGEAGQAQGLGLAELVTRYLGAFGPATVRDVVRPDRAEAGYGAAPVVPGHLPRRARGRAFRPAHGAAARR
jgi:Winged helix DNA-binding domain